MSSDPHRTHRSESWETASAAIEQKLFGKTGRLIFIGTFVATFLIGMLVMSSQMTFNSAQPIRADGMGYYFYLPSIFIYHDLSHSWAFAQTGSDWYINSGGLAWLYQTDGGPGRFVDKYPVGVAVLEAPFFLLAHLITYATGLPATGFSFWYQTGILAAAATYTALGCTILLAVLRRHVGRSSAVLTIGTILFATNLFSYASYDASFSHVYSFFLYAALIYLVPRCSRAGLPWASTLLVGAVLGMLVLVRNTNLIAVILILLWGITQREDVTERLTLLRRRLVVVVSACALAAVVFLPQLLYWKYASGSWLLFSYRGEGFDFIHPKVLEVLFSPNHGIFFWAPALTLSLVGLLFMRRGAREWSIPVFVVLPLFIWMMAAWWAWDYGPGYGHRALIDIYPLFAIPMALVFDRLRSRALLGLALAVGGLALWNIWLAWGYWIWIIPLTLETWNLEAYGLLLTERWQNFAQQGLRDGFFGVAGIAVLALLPALRLIDFRQPRRSNSPNPDAQSENLDTTPTSKDLASADDAR